MNAFRFGVVGESIRTDAQLTETARRVEDLGYSTLLLRDHFVEEPFGHQLAPMVALTVAATATTTLRLGTLVLANDYRHPVMLAKEAATLDVVCGGRFELGLGAGWLRDEYVRAGMSFAAPGVRVDRLEEAIHVLKALFDGRPVSFAGQHYHIADLESFPRPVARPRPPLLIGAGSKRMLQISGREADIVNILPKALPNGTISEELSERTPETTKQKVAWIRAGAGERFDEIELSALISPLISDDARDAAAQFASARGWGGHAAEQVLDMPSAFVGPVERIIDLMHERREVYGFSYYIVSDRAIDTFAPIVAKLTGA